MEERYAIELAKGAYNAYGMVTEYKNYQGLPMPEWDSLSDKIKEAWVAAAKYIHAESLKELPRA